MFLELCSCTFDGVTRRASAIGSRLPLGERAFQILYGNKLINSCVIVVQSVYFVMSYIVGIDFLCIK